MNLTDKLKISIRNRIYGRQSGLGFYPDYLMTREEKEELKNPKEMRITIRGVLPYGPEKN